MIIKDPKTGKKKDVRLPAKFKEKWVAALRSGKFEQVTGALEEQFTDDDYDKNNPSKTTKVGYCCLGVACKITHPNLNLRDKSLITNDEFGSKYKALKVPKLIHGNVKGGFDNDDKVDKNYNPVVEKLTSMNDKGISFKKIAAFIEKNL